MSLKRNDQIGIRSYPCDPIHLYWDVEGHAYLIKAENQIYRSLKQNKISNSQLIKKTLLDGTILILLNL